jgi:3-deoxy-D-manno-octulosonate 8-phosphate phosphatase (KDO 8-P phosphatase)
MTRPDLPRLLRRVRALALDVDGVLTDGGMYYGPRGEALKKFNVKDGMGIRLVREAGIAVVFITGEKSPAVLHRAAKLRIRDVYRGVEDKAAALRKFLTARKIAPQETVYVGDDLGDLPAMRLAGIAVAVADAVAEVRRAAHWVTSRRGGDAAVREVCDALLLARRNSPQVSSPTVR